MSVLAEAEGLTLLREVPQPLESAQERREVCDFVMSEADTEADVVELHGLLQGCG